MFCCLQKGSCVSAVGAMPIARPTTPRCLLTACLLSMPSAAFPAEHGAGGGSQAPGSQEGLHRW